MTGVRPPSGFRLRLRRTALIPGLLTLVVAGCVNTTVQDYERRVARLEQTVSQKNHELVAQQATIDELHRQLQEGLKHLPANWSDKTFYPEQIKIDGLSGGEDYDGLPGDDGVTVYLKPIDKAGDVIKAAGIIRVQLYDLADPPNRNLIGEYHFPIEESRELWYGKLMTYHYTLKCPWRTGPPAHTEITIRATFQDYLTRRIMSAQTTCTVRRPP